MQNNPKETISTFRRRILQFILYIPLQFLFVDFHVPLNKQSISTTNRVSMSFSSGSTPQSCPNNLRSRLTTRTWSKRWGWDWRAYHGDVGVRGKHAAKVWRWSNEEIYVVTQKGDGLVTSHLELVNMSSLFLFLSNIWQVSCLETSELFRCLGLSLRFHSCRTPALSEHHGGPKTVSDSWVGIKLHGLQVWTVCSKIFSVSFSFYVHLYFQESFPDEHVAC